MLKKKVFSQFFFTKIFFFIIYKYNPQAKQKKMFAFRSTLICTYITKYYFSRGLEIFFQ